MTRSAALAVALVLLVTAGCGTETAKGTTTSTSTLRDPLNRVATEFGRAYITGDMTTVTKLLTPESAATIPDALRASFDESTAQSKNVELRDFKVTVDRSSATEATAAYSGQRCSASTPSPTTTAGDSPGSTAPVTTAPTPLTTCVDIAEQSLALTPFTFMKVDGQWYAQPPEPR